LFGEPESSPPRSQNGLAVRPSVFNKRTSFNHHLNTAGTPSWWPLNTSPVPFATQLYLQPNDAPYSGSKEIANSVGRSTGLHRYWVQCGQYCRWGVAQPRFNSCQSMYHQRDPSALASLMRLAGHPGNKLGPHSHAGSCDKRPLHARRAMYRARVLAGRKDATLGGQCSRTSRRPPSQQSYNQSRRKWPLVTKQGPNGHFDVTEYPYLNIYMYF
jgi:hypothetical protein